jgi:hypothetical protein
LDRAGGNNKIEHMENKEPVVSSPVRKKLTLREFVSLGEVGGYFFRKKDPARATNFSIRSMHMVNKISITIFLAGVIYIIIKRFFL